MAQIMKIIFIKRNKTFYVMSKITYNILNVQSFQRYIIYV